MTSPAAPTVPDPAPDVSVDPMIIALAVHQLKAMRAVAEAHGPHFDDIDPFPGARALFDAVLGLVRVAAGPHGGDVPRLLLSFTDMQVTTSIAVDATVTGEFCCVVGIDELTSALHPLDASGAPVTLGFDADASRLILSGRQGVTPLVVHKDTAFPDVPLAEARMLAVTDRSQFFEDVRWVFPAAPDRDSGTPQLSGVAVQCAAEHLRVVAGDLRRRRIGAWRPAATRAGLPSVQQEPLSVLIPHGALKKAATLLATPPGIAMPGNLHIGYDGERDHLTLRMANVLIVIDPIIPRYPPAEPGLDASAGVVADTDALRSLLNAATRHNDNDGDDGDDPVVVELEASWFDDTVGHVTLSRVTGPGPLAKVGDIAGVTPLVPAALLTPGAPENDPFAPRFHTRLLAEDVLAGIEGYEGATVSLFPGPDTSRPPKECLISLGAPGIFASPNPRQRRIVLPAYGDDAGA